VNLFGGVSLWKDLCFGAREDVMFGGAFGSDAFEIWTDSSTLSTYLAQQFESCCGRP